MPPPAGYALTPPVSPRAAAAGWRRAERPKAGRRTHVANCRDFAILTSLNYQLSPREVT